MPVVSKVIIALFVVVQLIVSYRYSVPQWMCYNFRWGNEHPSALLIKSSLPTLCLCLKYCGPSDGTCFNGCVDRWDVDDDGDVDLKDFALIVNFISIEEEER